MTEKSITVKALQRQLEIEAALERVRARSMAMQSSEELSDVLSLLFQQFDLLGITPKTVWLTLWKPEENTFTYRSTGTSGLRIQGQQVLDIDGMEIWRDLYNKWKTDTSDSVEVLFYSKEDLGQLFSLLEETYSTMPAEERLTPEHFPDGGYSVQGHCKFGYIGYTHTREPSEEDKAILTRFATEFGRVYQRFLDIENAEAQAREAQIEATLERVRAASMAMHRSSELGEVAAVLFDQMNQLLGKLWTCGFVLCEKGRKEDEWWLSMDGGFTRGFFLPNVGDYTHATLYEGWENGDDFRTVQLEGDSLQEHYDWLMNIPTAKRIFEDMAASGIQRPEWQKLHAAYFSKGYLCIITEVPCEEEEVFKRFAQAFDLAYTRFLDLQKAEFQAWEAQIEAALERVRARSMAMHTSDELLDLSVVLFQELDKLGVRGFFNCGFVEIDEERQEQSGWTTMTDGSLGEGYYLPLKGDPVLDARHSAWKKGIPVFLQIVSGKELEDHMAFAMPTLGSDRIWEMTTNFPDPTYFYCFNFSQGYLSIITGENLSEEAESILIRFTRAFEQAYIRFMDLKKAEAQAREAQIEAALERVRSRSMAMHQTSELQDVINTVYQQLRELKVDISGGAFIAINSDIDSELVCWAAGGSADYAKRVTVPFMEMPIYTELLEGIKKGPGFFEESFSHEEKQAFLTELFKNPPYSETPTSQKKEVLSRPGGYTRSCCVSKNTSIFIINHHGKPFSEEDNQILRRMGRAFEQTYTRFLDLQRAEEQAREAQIEAALERVRSKTMAMHNSQDVGDTVISLFHEVMKLGLDDSIRCGIGILEGYEGMETWSANSDKKGKVILKMGMLNMSIHPMLIGLKKAWQKGDKTYSYHFAGADVTKYYTALNMEPEYPIHVDLNTLTDNQFANIFFFTEGILFAFTENPLTEEAKRILGRFASVFGQTYRRYLDLLKAEAQAREAQIETALERVRARTMAMHKSEELGEVAAVLFEQIDNLGATLERLNIGIVREEEGVIEWWSTEQGGRQIDRLFKGSIDEPTTISKVYSAWKESQKSLVIDQTGHELQQWISYVTEVIGLPFDPKLIQERRVHSAAFFKHGALLVSSPEPLPGDSMNLLERFAAVFEQTYTRFLDLQKAEKQAREAEIEAALERVRARTMAMHNTDDIAVTVTTFFEELISLGLGDSTRCGIGILSPSEIMEVWTASIQNGNKSTLHRGLLNMAANPMLAGLQKNWSEGESLYEYVLKGAEKIRYFKTINEAPEYPVKVDLDTLPPTVYHYSFIFPQGTLFVFAESPLQEEIRNIFTRFSSVFGQTYTRYLDLQKAEERARESRIEAALERVRAKALAMHSSEDLRQTITAIFEELKNLNVKTIRLGLGLLNPVKPEGEIVTSRIDKKGEIIEVSGNFELVGHPVLSGVYDHFKKQLDYFPVLEGDQIDSYYAALTRSVDVQGHGTDAIHYGCFLYFPEGCLYSWAAQPQGDAQIEILKKFSRVVEITYRRYNDLIESEAREKEAIKQASLDRVRAEIASMRTTKDLERITPLIWKELTILGIPFFRCGVFIMDEASQMVHVYLTTPEGEALAAMDLPFDFEMSLIQKGVEHWRKQEPLVEEWDQKQFIEMTKILLEQGQVKSVKSYQAGEKPPVRLVLHQVPFAQGMLYVGSAELLSTEEMDIVQALTRTFAVAYARYEDFKELEKAKKKVENTLTDLKATQAQLIQSEKMASLGELTAGIAHEIKNPLNFVNNFSEVSRELLEELMEEMENGDLEEVRALAGDVIQNLEKIVHHGQRADSIVKGMLQHSRSGDGKKEPTDLNELADEYLRLAYHGLRAKDKSFNAAMESDFDHALGKVNVVPQDIGRVLLNLITNAFHAVSERKASAPEGYDPTVWVQTKKTAEGVEISVRDNGGGIPDKIVDKIFQPFFTTKPTGQGTGLGLSLSYDIVKAHGGELNVETVEGEGTTFYINFKTTS